MEDEDSETAEESSPVPETVSFPFDRMTVARFRETFPRARWSDTLKAWTVPGRTARRRIDHWLAKEAGRRPPYEEERGRDAYDFEPILSPYLSVSDRGLRIRTPYSHKVVEELRQIPFARWLSDDKCWEVPYASYDELQHRWQSIEEAAKRAEPAERRKRAQARKGTPDEVNAKRRAAERKRHRIAVPCEDLPPLETSLSTSMYKVIVITDVTGELADHGDGEFSHTSTSGDLVWATWRLPTLDELIHAWPAKAAPSAYEQQRGWWRPTLDELREARRLARSRERRHRAAEAPPH